MMAIEKSNDGLSPPPKLLISHGLPVLSGSNHQMVRNHPGSLSPPPKLLISHGLSVLSGSNPQVVRNHPGSTTTPTPPTKKATSDLPPTHTLKKKRKRKTREKMGKKEERKRELSLRILPRRTCLLTSLYGKRLVRRGLQQQYLILTRDRRAAGSSLTGVTALWSLSKTHLS